MFLALLLALAPNDALFPEAGSVAGTLATGIPYLAIGEVAYGVSDRFAAGIVGGVTPKTVGGGVRLRGVLFERGDDRILLGSPILYYPATKGLGNEPWLLAMPQLLAERAFDGGSRLHFGAGLALAACTDAIGAALSGTLSHAHAGGGFMGGVWQTATVGGTTRLGPVIGFADASLVFHGRRLAVHDWIGGPPVVLTLGVKRAF